MAEEIGFENGRNSNFQGLVTLTFKLFVDGRTDVRTDGHFSPSNIIRSTFGSRPKNVGAKKKATKSQLQLLSVIPGTCIINCNKWVEMKKHSERHKYCMLAVLRQSQKISPHCRPLPGGTGRPKFNQLEMVTTFTYRPSLVGIDARNFELSW